MRIIHAIVSDAFAGTERYVGLLAAAQGRAGHDVVVVGGAGPEMGSMLEEVGMVGWRSGATVTEVLKEIRRAARPGAPDVVHAHLTAAEISAAVAFPLKHHGPLVVSTRHIAARRGSTPAARIAGRLVASRLDGQLAPSRFLADRVDGPTTVIPPGIPNCERGSHDRRVVLVPQRLERDKDPETAVRAWAASGLAARGWEMHFAGAGRAESQLRHLAQDLAVDGSCRFLGRVDDIMQRIGRSRIVLCTGPAESFGLAALEAMASGTAVVASRAGGHLETVGADSDPALFAVGDHRAAAALLRQLAMDDERCREYGGRLQDLQRRRFSLSPFADAVLEWYRSLR